MGTFLRPSKKSLKNGQHFSFIQAFITVMQQQGFSAQKIVTLLGLLMQAFEQEDVYYKQARNSELIEQRNAADRRRDTFYSKMHAIVRAWANSGDPDHELAANTVLKVFKLYKVETAAQIEEESGQMDNLKGDLMAPEMQAHLATLHLTWLFNSMCTAHEEVKSIRLQEGAELGEKVMGALAAARKECDRLYDELTYLIEAFSKTADDPTPYEDFMRTWNGTLKMYQDMLDRKSGSGSSSDGGLSEGGSSNEGGSDSSGSGLGSGSSSEGGESGGSGSEGGGSSEGDDLGGGTGTITPGGGGSEGGDNGGSGGEGGDGGDDDPNGGSDMN